MTRWLFIGLLCSCFVNTGCASAPGAAGQRMTVDYDFCKVGMSGDYRVATEVDPQTSIETVLLFIFPVGGPYDADHALCAISGDHAILDLGKGKQL